MRPCATAWAAAVTAGLPLACWEARHCTILPTAKITCMCLLADALVGWLVKENATPHADRSSAAANSCVLLGSQQASCLRCAIIRFRTEEFVAFFVRCAAVCAALGPVPRLRPRTRRAQLPNVAIRLKRIIKTKVERHASACSAASQRDKTLTKTPPRCCAQLYLMLPPATEATLTGPALVIRGTPL